MVLDKEIKKLNFILDESEFALQSDKIIYNIHELCNTIKNSVKNDVNFIKSTQHSSKEI